MNTTPRKLATVIKTHNGKYHRIAKTLGVNVYWVYRYIKHGQEPSNLTIRAKMFLPKKRKPHTGRSGFAKLPAHVQWWRKLPKDQRNEWVKSAYNASHDL